MPGRQAIRVFVQQYWLLLVAACFGFALSCAAWFAVSVREEHLAAAELNSIADNHLVALQGGINTYLNKLVALRALYKSVDKVTRAEFQTFSNELLLGQSAILSVSWIPRVSRTERAAHELEAVRSGLVGYHITSATANGDLAPSPERNEYFPILYTLREPPGSRIYGFDINDGGLRQRTLERARDTDHIGASSAFVLRSGEGDRKGFFVTLPVYRADQPHDTVEDRRRNLVGFVQGTFQIGVLIETTLKESTTPGGLDLYFFSADTNGNALPLYFHPSRRRAEPSAPRPLGALTAERYWSGELKVADTSWKFIAAPIPDGAGTANHVGSRMMLAGCLLITFDCSGLHRCLPPSCSTVPRKERAA
jgi:CHASE1-domain containing sensor protein